MQALELLHSEFDIDLLLDINMPRLGGFGVLEVMKQRNWLQEIPVIITSSEDDESFIQKAYTTAGDELLQDMPVSHDDPLMRTAHEICRWHHERGDGRGYPDGLKGDEIPVSAQVVALADVYDALTSDRCYKKAFSHETAMQMILNGECGAFNPLLLECFSAVGATLHKNLQHEPSEFDYRLESHRLSAEMLEQHSLPTDNRELQLLPLAHANAVFFAEQSGGLQFVYDRWMNKVPYTNWDADEAHRQQTLYLNEGDTVNLLDREIHDALVKQVRQTSPAQPDVTMPATLHIAGEDKPYALTVRTAWLPGDGAYSYALGQFRPEGGGH